MGDSLLPAPLLTGLHVSVAWAGSQGSCSRTSSPEEFFFNLLPPGTSHPSPHVSEASLIYCLPGPRDTLDLLPRRLHVSQLTHWCLFIKCLCVLVGPARSIELPGLNTRDAVPFLREAGRQPSTRTTAAGEHAGSAVTGELGSRRLAARPGSAWAQTHPQHSSLSSPSPLQAPFLSQAAPDAATIQRATHVTFLCPWLPPSWVSLDQSEVRGVGRAGLVSGWQLPFLPV